MVGEVSVVGVVGGACVISVVGEVCLMGGCCVV